MVLLLERAELRFPATDGWIRARDTKGKKICIIPSLHVQPSCSGPWPESSDAFTQALSKSDDWYYKSLLRISKMEEVGGVVPCVGTP